MPRHFGSVSERSAIPGIVVLRKTPDDVPQFVKQYRDLRFWSVSVVTRNRQHEVTSGPRERSPWVQLHNARSTIKERPVAIQLDDRVSASILSCSSGPWVLEKLPTRTVSHAVNVRSSSHLHLEVQRPEYFGGVGIGFLEPCGARISRLQDLKNLPTRARSYHPVYLGQTIPAQRERLYLAYLLSKIDSAGTTHKSAAAAINRWRSTNDWCLFRQPVTHIFSSPIDCNFFAFTRSIAGGFSPRYSLGLGPRSAGRFLGAFIQPNYLRERWSIVDQIACPRELDYLFLLGSSSGLT